MDQPIEWEDANDWSTDGGKVKTARFHEFTLNIRHDDSGAASPLDWDNLTTIVIKEAPRRGQLGHRQPEWDEERALERGGFPLLARYLRMTGQALYIVPLSVYDDWRPSVRTDPGGDPEMLDGFALVTKESAEMIGTPPEHFSEVVEQDVKTYSQFLEGEVYGWEVLDENDEILDSVWGYIGDMQYVQSEAEENARWHYQQKYPIPATRERVGV